MNKQPERKANTDFKTAQHWTTLHGTLEGWRARGTPFVLRVCNTNIQASRLGRTHWARPRAPLRSSAGAFKAAHQAIPRVILTEFLFFSYSSAPHL